MSTPQVSASQQDRRLRVFLCHASGDKQIVRDLYHRLKADGFAPWLDEEELLPGQNWQEEIPDAVRACDIVVVCLSQKSVTKEGYLQREIREALSVAEEKPEGTIFLIPARLEPVDVPKRLSQWQWANLFQEDGYQRLVRALRLRANAIGVTVAAPANAVTSSAPATEAAPKQTDSTAAAKVEQADSTVKQTSENQPAPAAVAKQNPVAAAGEKHRFSWWKQRKYWYLAGGLIALVSFAVFIALGTNARHDALETPTPAISPIQSPSRTFTPSPTPTRLPSLSAKDMNQEGDKYYDAKDYGQARQWYEKAAAAGSADAMNNLGWLYESGLGVSRDYQQARQWHEKAAAAGSAQAMKNLGWLYQNGQGVTQDYQQARQWYEKAAGAGNTDAMVNLGWLYQNGLGVTQDYQQARQWYEKAAAGGNSNAMNNVGVLYGKGLGVTQDYQQARQWYEKAAAGGNSNAMYNLGIFYANGRGVTRDYTQARQWYEKAAAAGDPDAKQRIQELPK